MKRKRGVPSSHAQEGGSGSDDDDMGAQADPLAHTLRNGGKDVTNVRKEGRAKPIERIAGEYACGSGSAVDAARGGKTSDFLSEHGMIEHRVAAITSGKYELLKVPPKGKGNGQLCASFKAVKKQLSETVQRLDRDELSQLLRSLRARGSSRRSTSFGHLLTPREMAARSAAVFWSFAFEFGGDIQGGVATLLGEL